jgi:phenylacetic acid degradation operon negative regulatory protein
MRARSALFTVFGDMVRPSGGEAWLTTLTVCMHTLGFTPEATRTALHRMAGEGWVEPRRVGRYAAYQLTPRGVDRLEEAAARIYRLRAAPWDGRWRLLLCPPAGRDAALGKALRWMGFGRLNGDVWVSPHDHGSRLDAVLTDHGVIDAMPFLAERNGHDGAIVAAAWDLAELRDAHGEFIARWRPARPPADPAKAFAARIHLVHHWRSFLFLDPGLPDALLPADWLGEQAAARFGELYEAVREPAERFYGDLTAATPPELELAGDRP